MGLESSRYSRIQIAMTTGSDPESYDWGRGGDALSVGVCGLMRGQGVLFQQILEKSTI